MNALRRLILVAALLAGSSACSILTSFEQPAESGVQCTDDVDNDGNGLRDCEESACRDICFPCGNGRPDTGEVCDDGNPDNTDACLDTCMPATCGDGFVHMGVEECDDMNGTPGDGCEPGTCLFTCGTGHASDTRGIDPQNGHCYLGFMSPTDPLAANQACTVIGGYLAVPDDGTEDALIRSVASGPASLGLADFQIDSFYQFRMVTGNFGTEYLNFSSGQPDAPLDAPVCVSYDGAAPTWQDDSCQALKPYVCELEPMPCGDFVLQPGEECDDGNMIDDDGCSNSCVDTNECALGLDTCSADADCINEQWRQGSRGYSCQCHGGFVGDGFSCTAIPQAPVFTEHAPVPVTLTQACTTATSHAGRKIAIDPFGALYAVMLCNGDVNVATSVDAGATWSAPQSIGSAVDEVAVVGVQTGRAVVAMQLSSGDVVVRETIDFGTNWGAFQGVGPPTSGRGLGIATDGVSVLVAYFEAPSGHLRINRSNNLDLSSFSGVSTLAVVSGDVLVNPQNPSEVWAVGDSAGFHLTRSADGGQTFPGPEHTPTGAQPQSDWAIGGGSIFVTGGSDQVHVISIPTPDTSMAVTNLPPAVAGERAITADATGAAVVAQTIATGGVQVVRLGPGQPMFDAPTSVDVGGSDPGITSVPNGLVAVIYTAGTQVRVAIVAP